MTGKMFRAVSRLGVVHHLARHARRNFGFTAVVAQEASGAGDKSTDITDPIQNLFLEKIREYKQRSVGGKLVDSTPQVEARLKEELEKVERVLNPKGQDMQKFPSLAFEEPVLDPIGLADQGMNITVPEDEKIEKEQEEDNKPYFAK